MLDLFRVLENETLDMISMRERRKSKHKFGGSIVCKAEEVRKYFVNPTLFAVCISEISHELSFYCIRER